MNALTTFSYQGTDVRTVRIDNETWWVLKDVCDVLELSNPSTIAGRLDQDEKQKVDPKQYLGSCSNEPITVITESGLYSVILLSRKPEAIKFKRWITHDVLPTIRRHGLYAADDLLNDPDLFIQALTALKDERAKNAALSEQANIQERQIAEMRPKAGYFDVVIACKDAVAISVIAKDYGWSAKRMNRFLNECGVQFKQGKIWLLYQCYAPNGFTVTQTHLHPDKNGEPHSRVHTYWTQKGRLFIYETMKAKGHLPLIERGSAA